LSKRDVARGKEEGEEDMVIRKKRMRGDVGIEEEGGRKGENLGGGSG